MLNFIHTADWHLGSPKNWGMERIEGTWINRFFFLRGEAIRQIIDEAIKNKVSAVILAGDVLDAETLVDTISKKCENFLVSYVIEPLQKENIKLIMTTGNTHDQKKNTKGETKSTKLLCKLTKEFPEDVILLVPHEISSINKELKNKFILDNTLISCDMPVNKSAWIELCHNPDHKLEYHGNKPLYSARGHKHIVTFDYNNGVFYPGIPFARSSGSDNNFTDVGPRYCLLINSESSFPKRIKLDVPEAAVFKKTNNYWLFYYYRNEKNQTWRTEKFPQEMDLRKILEKIRKVNPNIGFISFVLDKEEINYYDKLYHELMNILGDNFGDKLIQSEAKKNNIITAWVDEF